MRDYAAVDRVINAWVKATSSSLYTEWAGQPARFFHLPGKPPFECFQVSVDPPDADAVTLHARAIDTNDDNELDLERSRCGSVEDLDAILSAAIETVEAWKERPGPNARKGPEQ